MARVSSEAVSKALLEIGAVQFRPDNPVVFKSGIVSPVYVDNRRLPSYPDQWDVIVDGLAGVVEDEGLDPDVYAGVAVGAIFHAAALARHPRVRKPVVGVRQKEKDHGLGGLIVGDVRAIAGKKALVVEDHVTTAGSVETAILALREEEVRVNDALVITSYGFVEAIDRFAELNVELHVLATFRTILEVAKDLGVLNADQVELVGEWLNNPKEWGK